MFCDFVLTSCFAMLQVVNSDEYIPCSVIFEVAKPDMSACPYHRSTKYTAQICNGWSHIMVTIFETQTIVTVARHDSLA